MWWTLIAACGSRETIPEPPPAVTPPPVAAIAAPSGGFAVTVRVDRSPNAGGGDVPMALALGADGGVAIGASAPVAIHLDGDGRTFDLGPPAGPIDEVFVAQLDPAGRATWAHTLGTSGGQTFGDLTRVGDQVWAAWTAYGSAPIAIGDRSLPAGQGADAIVAAFGPDGAASAALRLGDDRDDARVALAPAADGVFVAWHAEPETRGGDAVRERAGWRLVRVRGDAILWSVEVADGGHWTTTALAAHPDGGVVAAISTDGGGDPPREDVLPPPRAPDGLGGLLGEPQGLGLGLGMRGGGGGQRDVWLARYDADGHRRWIRKLAADVAHEAMDVAVGAEGAIVVVGYRDGGGWVTRVDPEGAALQVLDTKRVPVAVHADAGGFVVDLPDGPARLEAGGLRPIGDGRPGDLRAVTRGGGRVARAAAIEGPPESWAIEARAGD